jgi:hypothetical protein
VKAARAFALAGALVASAFATSQAQADGKLAPLKVEGFAPDAQLVGGGGFGLGGALDNYFLGRLRLGALYAHEPWIANAGVTVDVGALGNFGVGCELELNTWRGLFADVGLARVDEHQWMSHLGVGYTVLGLEWQHLYSDAKPRDAFMFEVRLPLGTWWFLVGSKTADRTVASVRKVQPLGPQPTAATAKPPEQPTVLPIVAPVAPSAPSDADRDEARQLAEEAQRAMHSGDYPAAVAAWQRAYQRTSDAKFLLQLAEAEIAQGKLRAASDELRRFLAALPADSAPEARAEAQRQLDDVQRRIAHLRLELRGAHGDERVELDGNVEPAAALGYDVALDPGDHALSVRRAERALAAQTFHVGDGELLRISVDLAAATP